MEGRPYMQTLNQDIKDRTFKPVYLLFGEEASLKKSYKSRLREALTDGDTMNYNYFEGKDECERNYRPCGHHAFFCGEAPYTDGGQRIP